MSSECKGEKERSDQTLDLQRELLSPVERAMFDALSQVSCEERANESAEMRILRVLRTISTARKDAEKAKQKKQSKRGKKRKRGAANKSESLSEEETAMQELLGFHSFG